MAMTNVLRCPHCGMPIRDSFRFCMECGEPVNQEPEVRKKQNVERPYVQDGPNLQEAPNQSARNAQLYSSGDARPTTHSVYERRELYQAPNELAAHDVVPARVQSTNSISNVRQVDSATPSMGLHMITQPAVDYESDVTEVYISPESKVGRARSVSGLGSMPIPSRSALDDEQTMVVQQDNYVLTSKDSNESYTLVLPCIIGRSRNASDVKVSTRASVSRRHARIFVSAGNIMIQDLGTTNGTYVNGAPVSNGAEMQLKDGCTVRLGDEDYLFELRRA